MRTRPIHLVGTILLVISGTGSCKSGLDTTLFVNPQFDFSFVERVAVIPFENQTGDQLASSRATHFTMTELLASGAVDVIEPGEVEAARREVTQESPRSAVLSTEQMLALGRRVDAQALILGSVNQAELLRAGQVSYPVVTVDLRMVETETGHVVWAVTQSERGGGISAKVLGTRAEPIAETTRRCIRNALRTLIN